MISLRKELQVIYSVIDTQVSRFESVHSESLKYLSALINVCSRVDSLRQAPSLGTLGQFVGARGIMVRQHLASAEKLVKALLTSLDIFEDVSTRLIRASEDAVALIPRASTLAEQSSLRTSSGNSIFESILWTETISTMIRKECLEKRAAVLNIQYDEFGRMVELEQAWTAMRHADFKLIHEWVMLSSAIEAGS